MYISGNAKEGIIANYYNDSFAKKYQWRIKIIISFAI